MKKLELRLLKLLIDLGQLGLDHGEFAIAVLEDGVRATEQSELLLFVLRAGVHLR